MPNENAKASQSKTIGCPRCGYDQRGVITAWTEQCPLDGTCAECGLEFTWADLLNPRLSLPDWCVESRKTILGLPWRALRTLSRTVMPWRMWRDIRMTHPVRWGRIVAYFVLLALALYVMAAISLGMRCVADLDMTLKGAFFGGNPVKIATTATRWQAFLHGSLTPYSTRPIATVTMGGSTVTQGGTTLTFGAATWTLGSPRTYVSGMIEHQWPTAAVAVAIPLSCALAFAALPISRKRAKVRWVHVARAMAYAYGLVWIAASLFMLASWHIVSPRVGIGFLGMIAFIYVMAGPIVLIAFWWATARLYLRMQHGLAVAVSVTLIGMLLPVTAAGAIWIARSG